MLPHHYIVLFEVARIRWARLDAWLGKHPANVGPPEATVSSIRIEVGISVAVMSAVMSAPPLNRTLHGTRARDREDELQGFGSLVRTVRPQTMVACGVCLEVSTRRMHWTFLHAHRL